jgi:hypothetical protein
VRQVVFLFYYLFHLDKILSIFISVNYLYLYSEGIFDSFEFRVGNSTCRSLSALLASPRPAAFRINSSAYGSNLHAKHGSHRWQTSVLAFLVGVARFTTAPFTRSAVRDPRDGVVVP